MLCHAGLERRDDWNVTAEAEHVVRGATGGSTVQDRGHLIRDVADAGVGGLGAERAEAAFGEDEKTTRQCHDTKGQIRERRPRKGSRRWRPEGIPEIYR